jgi:hypothetical protein
MDIGHFVEYKPVFGVGRISRMAPPAFALKSAAAAHIRHHAKRKPCVMVILAANRIDAELHGARRVPKNRWPKCAAVRWKRSMAAGEYRRF